jgi:uncharacterized protein (TIRG00374 family)
MARTSFLTRNWKVLVNIITIAALIIVVYAIRKQLVDTIKNFAHVNIWALLLLIPVEALNYHAQTKLYQGVFKAVDERLGYKALLRLSLELNFVNHVFPSGGVTGIGYFGLRCRNLGVRASKATLVQTAKLVLVFVSFEILLVIGMFALAINGHASNLIIFIGSSLSTLLLVGSGIFVYVISSKQRINQSLIALTKALNKVISIFRRSTPETIKLAKAEDAFNDYHQNYVLLRDRVGELKAPFGYALLANITEVAAVYVVYIAFGHFINIGAVILAYAIANFAGLVSVLPGGVGIYEALMTAVLLSTGVSAGISLPVTVMYRVLNTLIQIPPGYVFYHQTIENDGMETASHGNS